jgi:predicted DsbA family dithiol-disulfide isomerase
MPLAIDVVSDVVCPWCFIGKRRLEQAMAFHARARPDSEPPAVRWLPFQLNPDMPEAGMDRAGYYRRKFGDRMEYVVRRIEAAGRETGIEFRFDRITRQPSTLAAHVLIDRAAAHGKQDAVVEALFRAFFLEGVDLTRPERLTAVAVAAGLGSADVEAALSSAPARQQVLKEEAIAREIGVQGVPLFIFDRRIAVSGAQPAELLAQAMVEASAT